MHPYSIYFEDDDYLACSELESVEVNPRFLDYGAAVLTEDPGRNVWFCLPVARQDGYSHSAYADILLFFHPLPGELVDWVADLIVSQSLPAYKLILGLPVDKGDGRDSFIGSFASDGFNVYRSLDSWYMEPSQLPSRFSAGVQLLQNADWYAAVKQCWSSPHGP